MASDQERILEKAAGEVNGLSRLRGVQSTQNKRVWYLERSRS